MEFGCKPNVWNKTECGLGRAHLCICAKNVFESKCGRKVRVLQEEVILVGCLATARPRCQNGTPRVRHSVAVLIHGEGLRRGVAIVHRGQNFGFCFESLVFVHR